jgi:Holliday junction resolvase RusA-like endonuclease
MNPIKIKVFEKAALIGPIPMPPSLNKAYAQSGNRRHLSEAANKWYKNVILLLKNAKQLSGLRTFEKKLTIRACFYFTNPERCDTLNYTKLLWDAFEHAQIIKNDSLFFDEHCTKWWASEETSVEPHVHVYISEIKTSRLQAIMQTLKTKLLKGGRKYG